MKAAKSSLWLTLIFSLVFMHFMIASVYSFPLTLIPFIILYFIWRHFETSFISFNFILLLIFLFWPLFVVAVYSYQGGVVNYERFFRTYSLWIFSIITLMSVVIGRIASYRNYSRELIISCFIIIVFSLAQVVSATYFNTTFLYFPFGQFSYLGVNDASNLVGDGFARAHGFYLEPSFCALVLFFLASSLSLLKVSYLPLILATITVAIAILGSASGVLAMIGLIFFLLACSFISKSKRMVVIITLALVLYVLMVTFFDRAVEFGIEGSSGYWRLIAPLIIVSKVLVEYPIGVPFGQLENYVLSFGLQHGAGIGSSIDNGMYFLIFSFGWVSIPLFVVILIKISQGLIFRNSSVIIYWWFIFASLQFTGGVLLPEFSYILLLTTYFYRYQKFTHMKLHGGI